MSKTLISVLVLVVVLVGGYFIISSNKGGYTAPALNTGTDTSNQAAPTNGQKVAFSEFIKNGGSYKCDVKQAMSDFENSGTVYINGENIRGEFSTIAEGRPLKTSVIVRDGYTYIWSPSDEPGFGSKAKIQSDYNTYIWNADQIGDYNCEAWVADEATFTVPTNVAFREFN